MIDYNCHDCQGAYGVWALQDDLDVTLRLNPLAFDEGFRVSLVRLAGKVDDGRLFCFKRRSASLLPVQSIIDDSFNALAGAPRRRTRDLGCEVIDEGYRTAVAVGPSLY